MKIRKLCNIKNFSSKTRSFLNGVFVKGFLGGPIFEVLKNRPFRLLFVGEFISVLGDQFYLVAIPWLILQLTGSALAMGTVLAIASIPRAIFSLIGGVFIDRYSARKIMLLSNLTRFIFVAILALLVMSNLVNLFHIYIFSFFFGVTDAFFYPSQRTIVLKIVHNKDHLNAANALLQGTIQLSAFLGPGLAGLIIGILSNFQPGRLFEEHQLLFNSLHYSKGVNSIKGVGIALIVDALSFLFSLYTLWKIKMSDEDKNVMRHGSVMEQMKEVLRYVWADKIIRIGFIIVGTYYFFTLGPLEVGIPVLVNLRLPLGAVALGILLSSFGGGVLIGVILAGAIRLPRGKRLIFNLIVGSVLMGIGLIILSFTHSILLASFVGSIMGFCVGYIMIVLITLLQKRVPESMMGRVMSLAMFAYTGLLPLSQVLAGVIIQIDFTSCFLICGIAILIVTLFTLTRPELHMVEVELKNTTPYIDEKHTLLQS